MKAQRQALAKQGESDRPLLPQLKRRQSDQVSAAFSGDRFPKPAVDFAHPDGSAPAYAAHKSVPQ